MMLMIQQLVNGEEETEMENKNTISGIQRLSF